MNNELATQINSDYGYDKEYTTLNVPDAPAVGLVLMQRRDPMYTISLVYWGKDAKPKLTVVVEHNQLEVPTDEDFYVVARDEYIVDTYLHATATVDKNRIPIKGLKGEYA